MMSESPVKKHNNNVFHYKPLKSYFNFSLFLVQLCVYIIKLHQIAQYSEAAFEEPQLTWISNAQCADPEVFTTGSSQLNVVSCVMMDSSLGQHGIVLNLTFPKIVGSFSLSKLNYTLWQYKCEIVQLKHTEVLF